MAQQEWIVWGRRDDHASGQWIKLAGGTLRVCAREEAFRRAQGWETRLRTPGHPALGVGASANVDVNAWAETQQTQPSPASVAPLALPLDEIVCACGETVTPGHTHPLPLDEPVNVPADPDVEPQPYDMPSPEADALDRIADEIMETYDDRSALLNIVAILRKTGRLS